ncbi:GNAT family N-acetyltransferase [Paenibacillus sp. Marseille-P2973]|uniref:GNAT family N-acetyltransferase n=1 Tax=Paenibacillus sp. Marseille-P2973 TaxID=1871032 RepID=UPI001B38417C|nr:GNAT family N-acetyltransferase [Paenibacillus sp. Marseille-P2973]MBQ4898242.1 GNAT family N-acetyltransferase [Paenibacillus sp. Marseille-P2973]
MHELAQEDYYIVKPLLEGGHVHPELVSIIEGNNPGWIFVDQVTTPQSAIVWSKGMQGFYLIGDHTNEAFVLNLDDYIKSKIEPRMKEVALNHFEVSGHHDKWNMESIFPTRKLYQFEQLVLKLLNNPEVQKSIEIETINLKTSDWECPKYRNVELIDTHIGSFWSSRDDFMRNGFGYAAVIGNEIVGVCYSSFVTNDTHAIGIETVSSFQSKGVGTHLASLLTEEIYRNGFTPYWDCSLDNEPSKKLAERLGFTQVHRYTGSFFEL